MSAHAMSTYRSNIEVWPRIDASMTPTTVATTARVPTKFALEYLAALSGDLSLSSSPVAGTTIRVEIELSEGRCTLEANGNYLDVTLVAETNSGAVLLEALISDRLDGLAWGEDLQYQWSREPIDVTRQRQGIPHSVRSAIRTFLNEIVMSKPLSSFLPSHLRDTATVAAGLFGGVITGISLGFLLWQIV